MSLREYAKKRQLDRTREPGAKPRGSSSGRPIFVVQLHHASHRHYDFRLQVGQTLRSWAVPKGPSFDPAVKRLAAEVEDHPLDYARFEGVIPEGHYGAGHVAVFDTGVWSTDEDAARQLAKGHLRFELFGKKLKGGWHLIRTRGSARKPQWLLVKDKDRYAGKTEADDLAGDLPAPTAGTSARKLPARPALAPTAKRGSGISRARARRVDWAAKATKLTGSHHAKLPGKPLAPQLATLVPQAPVGEHWLHEIKWDGYRITVVVREGRAELWSRNGLNWTRKLPEIVDAIEALGLSNAMLDGELIAQRGVRSDFPALQATLSGDRQARLSVVLFDLLHVEGISLERCALGDRKALLAHMLEKPVAHLALSSHIENDGAIAFALAIEQGFEGVVSKRADRPYHAGRGTDWLKTKTLDSEEFAVVGVTPPKGNRTGLGALLLARHDPRDGWTYVGKAGSGLTDQHLARLATELGKTGTKTPTVKVPPNDTDLRAARWFSPRFVVEVHSRGLGSNGLLRQPTIKAVRMDKSIENVAGRRAKQQAAGNVVTHPGKVVFPHDGITKQQVADYYLAVMPDLLPGIVGRPLSVIRCPSGIAGKCFFQKHEVVGVEGVDTVRLEENSGEQGDYLVVRDAAGVMELVQFNALEFHPWGAKADAPDAADRLIFDLDPGPGVDWNEVRAAARKIRALLRKLELESFVRTSGGKGLHVVVPLQPAVAWEIAKPFTQAFAETMAKLQPDKFVATATKSRRSGRIFVDYLRNGRGATSVASFSLRARDGAPVATPISWEELSRIKNAAAFNLKNFPSRQSKLRKDPWAGFSTIKQSLAM